MSGGGEPTDDLTFLSCGLDEVHLEFGERGCQRKAGETSAGADVSSPGGVANGFQGQRREAVCDMHIEGLGGVTDSGRGIGFSGQGAEEELYGSRGGDRIRHGEAPNSPSHRFP